MKRKHTNQEIANETVRMALKCACLAACRRVLERIAAAKEMIFNEWRGTLRVPEQLVRLAWNEAEAAAWLTMYPDLVFPVRATEKVHAVVAWGAKQKTLRWARYARANTSAVNNRRHQQPRARL